MSVNHVQYKIWDIMTQNMLSNNGYESIESYVRAIDQGERLDRNIVNTVKVDINENLFSQNRFAIYALLRDDFSFSKLIDYIDEKTSSLKVFFETYNSNGKAEENKNKKYFVGSPFGLDSEIYNAIEVMSYFVKSSGPINEWKKLVNEDNTLKGNMFSAVRTLRKEVLPTLRNYEEKADNILNALRIIYPSGQIWTNFMPQYNSMKDDFKNTYFTQVLFETY